MSIFTLDVLEQELSGVKKVAITGHIRPMATASDPAVPCISILCYMARNWDSSRLMYLETF